MTYPTYSEQYLLTLTPKQVKGICKNLGIAPHFHKAVCIERIIEHQATVQPATPAPKTCLTCSFFDSHDDGTDRGWCTQFDKFAREHHQETQDCLNQGEKELTEQEAGEAWASFTVAAQVGDTFEIPGSPKAVVIDRYYRTPTELVFSVVLPDHKGDTLSWVLPMEPATEEVEQEWHTAQDEVLEVLTQQSEAIAPEPVIKLSDNLYRVLSSEGTHRYAVNTRKRTCTCAAGSYSRNCRHLKQADTVEAKEVEEWRGAADKVPAGWAYRGGWWVNHHGHRSNNPPVKLTERELAILTR